VIQVGMHVHIWICPSTILPWNSKLARLPSKELTRGCTDSCKTPFLYLIIFSNQKPSLHFVYSMFFLICKSYIASVLSCNFAHANSYAFFALLLSKEFMHFVQSCRKDPRHSFTFVTDGCSTQVL